MPKTKRSKRTPAAATQAKVRSYRSWTHILDKKHVTLIALVVVAILAIVARFVHIGADPPADVSWSQDLLTDPPQYSSYARDAVVVGDWNPLNYERLVFFYKNITGLFCFIVFSLFGPGIASANATAALLNLIAVGFLAWGTGRAFGHWAGLAAGLFLAVSYLFVSYGRQPFLEVASNMCLAFALS